MPRQIFEYHPTIGFRFIPGIKARIPHEAGGYRILTNSCGFRSNREFVGEKSKDARRILLFGNSFTAADAVFNEQRYSDLLEKMVPKLEVYNFALPGTGTDQQYLTYKEFATGIDHDLLALTVFVENIRRVNSRYRVWLEEGGKEVCFAKPYYTLEADNLVLHHVPVPQGAIAEQNLCAEERKAVDKGGGFPRLRKVINALHVREVALKVSRYQPLPEYDNSCTPSWRLLRAILAKWIRESVRPVLVIPLPLNCHIEGLVDPSTYQARFREIAAETDCWLHDPLSDLLKYPLAVRRRFRFARDHHLTPSGHVAIAESLGPKIQQILGVCPSIQP